MSARYDCTVPVERAAGISEAAAALSKGELAVLPTDTVYGVGADAFIPVAVSALISARGGGRHAVSRYLPQQIARFTVMGVTSTIAYVVNRHWVFGGPRRAADGRHDQDSSQVIRAVHESEMATQGERAT